LLGDADIAFVPYVVTVTVKTRTRGEMLTNRNQPLNTLGRGYARTINRQLLGSATGHRQTPHSSQDLVEPAHSETAATPWDRQSSFTSLTE
jgi:hypothetical protein